ncbi:hypothetical protein CA54_46910 [Symmachiella macrocystis]|uniref:SUKH-4 immunity protein n=1 Tax=Symmachiella macrocystis TaxID=2527985 RepID=A0A5C6BDT1_9PLAN|nr:SUKH-4 family immunity protein [Symmachiella macrocystis]TWU09449.1 hypothetical protein CA54_46910 [Symmachiella macrocystis]
MISPDDFRNRWAAAPYASKLISVSTASLAGLSISDNTVAFLTSAGLPADAAPFLSFGELGEGTLHTVAEQYSLASDFDCYHKIGSDDAGNPICFDGTKLDAIVYLDHDAKFNCVFINGSVSQLAESLLVYQSLVQQTQERNGEDAYLDGDIPEDVLLWLETEIARIDSAALADGCFWNTELASLRQEAT